MDFYLKLPNEKERAPDDASLIGIVLCAERDNLEVEFALKSRTSPVGVAEYQLRSALPSALRGKLPTAKQLECGISDALPRGANAKYSVAMRHRKEKRVSPL
jgi:hypothetical protein